MLKVFERAMRQSRPGRAARWAFRRLTGSDRPLDQQETEAVSLQDAHEPTIELERMRPSYPDLFVPPRSRADDAAAICEIARMARTASPRFDHWRKIAGNDMVGHRKTWEIAYILAALDEHGMIAEGKRGLGFAVGQEPLSSVLAARGCSIVATDLASDDSRIQHWEESQQWAGGAASLYKPDIVDRETFDRNVSHRAVDMNRIPEDLSGFDFTWSTCSFEHCGSLELGIGFLRNQMKCLRPGGVAVHTTEFNLTSNDHTLETETISIFRLRDIERAVLALREDGHDVAPIDLTIGDTELDRHVDIPDPDTNAYSQKRHMRLSVASYACTSIGLIIRKRSA